MFFLSTIMFLSLFETELSHAYEMTTVTDDQSELTMSVLMIWQIFQVMFMVEQFLSCSRLCLCEPLFGQLCGDFVKVNFKEPIYVGELVTFLGTM